MLLSVVVVVVVPTKATAYCYCLPSSYTSYLVVRHIQSPQQISWWGSHNASNSSAVVYFLLFVQLRMTSQFLGLCFVLLAAFWRCFVVVIVSVIHRLVRIVWLRIFSLLICLFLKSISGFQLKFACLCSFRCMHIHVGEGSKSVAAILWVLRNLETWCNFYIRNLYIVNSFILILVIKNK